MVTFYSIDRLSKYVDANISSFICLINDFFSGRILFVSRFNLNPTLMRSSYISMASQINSQSCFSQTGFLDSDLSASFIIFTGGNALKSFECASSAAFMSCLTAANSNFSPYVFSLTVSSSCGVPTRVSLFIPQDCSLYAY